jgi:Rap1a immunity proteins
MIATYAYHHNYGNKVADVVMDFLGDHPELRPASAASIAYIALQRAFPCEEQAH